MKSLVKKLTPKAREEEGSITFFVMFLFVCLFVFGGMAVDIARLESERVELQNVLDSAIFAAEINLDPDLNQEEIMDDFFEKSGIKRNESDNANWGIGTPSWDSENGNVQAWARRDSPNLFLSLYGFDKFNVLASAAVDQKYTDIEISLVVDVSKSMAFNGKIDDLRTAVGDFADQMFNIPYVKTHLTIIPFDYQTNAGRNLLTAFHVANSQAIDGYNLDGTKKFTAEEIYDMPSHCVNFDRGTYDSFEGTVDDGDYNVASLTQGLEFSSYTPGFDDLGNAVMVLNDTGAILQNDERMIVPTGAVTLPSSGLFRDRSSAWLWNSLSGSTSFDWYSNTFAQVNARSQSTKLGGTNSNTKGYDDPTCRYTESTDANGLPEPTGNGNNSILPFATTTEQVVAYMADLEPEGSTAGDLGLNWGVALLDPSMRNTVKALIDGINSSDGFRTLVPSQTIDPEFEGRPANYDADKTLKVLVHMSDGQNTLYQELTEDFLDRTYPLTAENRSNVFRAHNDGRITYSVKYTDSNGDPKFYCVSGKYHVFNNDGDKCGDYKAEDNAHGWIDDVYQPRELSKREVLEYFSVPDAIKFFFSGGTYSDIDLNAPDIETGDGTYSGSLGWNNPISDARFQAICDVAASKVDPNRNNYLTYTIAFDTTSHAGSVLSDCVGNDDKHFFTPVSGELGDTFDSIVASISKLRLTN